MEKLELNVRHRALMQGTAGIFGAVTMLILTGWLTKYLDSPKLGWPKLVLFGTLSVVGFTLALLGVWRLSVARNSRWDWRGVVALCLMILPGYPILFLYVSFVLMMFLGPLYGGK